CKNPQSVAPADKERDRDWDQGRDQHRDWDQGRDQHRDWDKGWDQHRDRDRDKAQDQHRDQNWDRDWDKGRDQHQDWDLDWDQGWDQHRERDRLAWGPRPTPRNDAQSNTLSSMGPPASYSSPLCLDNGHPNRECPWGNPPARTSASEQVPTNSPRTCKNTGTIFPQCAEETSLGTALIPCIPRVLNIGQKVCADTSWAGWTNDSFTGCERL
uniref:Uncharacterized protein n=1 Tax=Junco hyemalis TaxID=40217 RepID=A0A8C5JK97_JUNHY